MQLSQAPPEFELEIANYTAEKIAPGNNPATAFTPKIKPNNNGVTITNKPGAIIYLKLPLVEILIQALKSGSFFPLLISSSYNYLLTSATISMAASPTDYMVIAENQ